MSDNSFFKRLTQHERINFLLTNRIPRRYATFFMGWFSRINNPLVVWLSLRIWKLFADDLNLSEAKKTEFDSLHDCFIRKLKDGARSINQADDILISPCDAIIGAHGKISDSQLFQTKGFPYTLKDLVSDPALVERYRNGHFVTLRLKSIMYHRFHVPCESHVSKITYIAGDTWNVNPIALKRIEKLYCKNERAVIDLHLNKYNAGVTLVPVAAILVASVKLHCIEDTLDLKYKGPNEINCDAKFKKGDEMGYFQHGSTIIILTTSNFEFFTHIKEGKMIKMGEPLLQLKLYHNEFPSS